jgi:hypothetical protein
MKRVLLVALTAALALGGGMQNASAQKFELGARVGIGSQDMNMTGGGLQDVKSRLGWNMAAVSRIRIVGLGRGIAGVGLYFQPEVVYSQNSIKGKWASGDLVGDLRTSLKTVDVPLLLSLKASLVRVQAGPVFNLMNNYSSETGSPELKPLRGAVGYAVGASVDLGLLTVDGRYHGDFEKMSFAGSWKDVKSRFSSWSLGVGIMF